MPERQQFSTFLVDGLFFGVEVEKVQEVLRYQQMTRVPLASPVVRGLINLRGQIVTALDLRRRLDLSERPDGQVPMNVVIRTDDGGVSLLVDEIGDVVEVDESTFERPPDTLKSSARAVIRGVHKLNGRLMHVLDTEKVVNQDSEGKR
ncbi:MAG TPA: chemotaxis protein CheW [Terriglobia bacterium]|nr:chemotaxis protein CheW [Terriglobia bacterium]